MGKLRRARERKMWVGGKGEMDGYFGRTRSGGVRGTLREGEWTTRGVGKASLIISVPLSVQSCRERDRAVGS
jgi:hypothetical protein